MANVIKKKVQPRYCIESFIVPSVTYALIIFHFIYFFINIYLFIYFELTEWIALYLMATNRQFIDFCAHGIIYCVGLDFCESVVGLI